MIIETFPVGLLQCNCTIIADENTREAIVIDPGDDTEGILQRLEKHGLTAKQIVCTHTHIDHVGAIHGLQQRCGAPASVHKADVFLFENLHVQAEWIGIPCPERGVIDSSLNDGSAVSCNGVELGILHTPGSTSFHFAGDRNILFTGDTLFRQSIGRTDLWGGSHPEILASIKQKLMPFDDDTLVISGHGPSTTIGHERRHNPFITT